MASVQEANSDNLQSFRFSTQFHDKIRKKSLNICFLELLEGFCRD